MDQQLIDKQNRLIDRYVNGSLTGVELQEFMDRLAADVTFRETVAFRNLLIEGVRFAADEEIKAELIEEINYKKPVLPFGLRMILVFMAIIAGGILLFNYVGNDRVIKKPVITFKWFTGKGKSDESEKQSGKQKEKSATLLFEDSTITDNNLAADTVDSALNTENDSTQQDVTDGDGDAEIVVKKDQLIFSATVIPKSVLIGGRNESPSLAAQTAQKLNPPADLPEQAEENAYELKVWISPVNYRGYRLLANEIQVYGLEQPDKIRIYKIDKRIVLRYGNELYDLVPAGQFQPYRSIRDVEIINACK